MKIHHCGFPRYSQPDLFFDWLGARDLQITNSAARRIANRYGLPINTAATLAGLSGLGST